MEASETEIAPAAPVSVTDSEDGGFAALGLQEGLLSTLTALGYEEPTPIQRAAIPPLLEGRDLLGQAATGTGKTAAFALPLLHTLLTRGTGQAPGRAPTALVLVPTRELAMQVAQAIHRYSKGQGVMVLPIYGGQPMPQQLRALHRGVDVVVATPGRALDHLRRSTLDMSQIAMVVLDEADEMLDMGFAEDLEAILAATPATRQTALFSATMPAHILAIGKRHLRDPAQVRIAPEREPQGTVPRVRQVAFIVQRAHKLAALDRVLDMEAPTSALIFCRTRTEVDELVDALGVRGYRAEPLHGGMSQEQRDRVMGLFRQGTAELLVATDVAARGLDIEHLSHVVNYDVPNAPEAYVHRIGRTGRAGREGVAITFAEPREHRMLRNIEQATRQKIEVAMVPSVAELRARRLDVMRATLREALDGGAYERYYPVVDVLAEDFALRDIAAAALQLGAEARDGDREEHEIPSFLPPPERPRRDRPARPDFAEGRPEFGGGRRASYDRVRLFIGLGRRAGVRPQDLVGAITNEAGVNGRAIGAIEISERFSLVEVPAAIAGDIISALQRTKIKGLRAQVRTDHEPPRERFDRGARPPRD